MKKIAVFLKKNAFLLLLLLFFVIGEMVLTHFDPLKNCDVFWRNDFELTQLRHPEEVWDKVFFGNSVVISG